MKVRFKKLLFAALLSSLFLGAGLLTGATSPVATTAEASPALTSELQPLFPPFPPANSSAHFNGTWCYIDCSDQTFTTVRTFSIANCCEECANFCSSGCVASGQGPSVICGNE